MKTKETRKNIIQAGRKAVDELVKVAKEPIVDTGEEVLQKGEVNDLRTNSL